MKMLHFQKLLLLSRQITLAHLYEVGSCLENIELSISDSPKDTTGAFQAINGRISIELVHYKDMPEKPVGYLSDDFLRIEFH